MTESYISLTSPPIPFSFSPTMVKLTDLTTNYISTDWANIGSGKFQYNGTTPKLFIGSITLSQSASTSTSYSEECYLLRNTATISQYHFGMIVTTTSYMSDSRTISSADLLTTLVVYPGDYFNLGLTTSNITSIVSDLSCSITLISTMALYRNPMYVSYVKYSSIIYPIWSFTTGSGYTQITNDLITIGGTSDWVNNGAGKFTYIGTIPLPFVIQGVIGQTSSSTNFEPNLYFVKNTDTEYTYTGIVYNTNQTGPYEFDTTGRGLVFTGNNQVGAIINPGDSFSTYIRNNTNTTGTSTNFFINFTFLSV